MVGLKGSRVIVVDDDEQDALPILRALAKKGISAAFFNGSVDEVPPEDQRLSGVRLAVLDMDLIGGGADDKSKVAALANFLGKVLGTANGPYVVVAWTKHAELLTLFDAYLFSNKDLPKPIVVVQIEKAECKTDNQFSLDVVSMKLEEALAKFSPLLFLQAWEEKCFEAATDVTNALSDLATPAGDQVERWRDEWRIQLLQLMHAMAAAEAGKHLVDGDSGLTAFYSSLNPLHADKMDYKTSELSDPLKRSTPEIVTTEASRDCGSAKRAKINSMLHLAFGEPGNFRAGNIYAFPNEQTLAGLVPSLDEIVDDFLDTKRDAPERTEQKRMMVEQSVPILVEANPICDHAQKNVRLARLVAGLLLPAGQRARIKGRADFVWSFGPLLLSSDVPAPGEHYLVLSARHLVSMNVDQVSRMKLIVRLRGQGLAGMQAWLGHHSARPGVLLLQEQG